jgi:hypothetical protein
VFLQAENASLLSEEGHTLVVNAHGGLVKLAMKVQPGQTLVLKNRESGEQQECRVGIRKGAGRHKRSWYSVCASRAPFLGRRFSTCR